MGCVDAVRGGGVLKVGGARLGTGDFTTQPDGVEMLGAMAGVDPVFPLMAEPAIPKPGVATVDPEPPAENGDGAGAEAFSLTLSAVGCCVPKFVVLREVDDGGCVAD